MVYARRGSAAVLEHARGEGSGGPGSAPRSCWIIVLSTYARGIYACGGLTQRMVGWDSALLVACVSETRQRSALVDWWSGIEGTRAEATL